MDEQPESEMSSTTWIVNKIGQSLGPLFDPFHPERDMPVLLSLLLLVVVAVGVIGGVYWFRGFR